SEVSDARWGEFDIGGALWTVPSERFKSDRQHLVPLSGDALNLLCSVPRFVGDCVFSTNAGQKPVDGFSKAKARLDAAMQVLLGDVQPFVVHDLRRTVRSRLSELRVPPVVAELVIGHSLPGLLRVYDQWDHIEERRAALEKWATRLHQIIDPTPN